MRLRGRAAGVAFLATALALWVGAARAADAPLATDGAGAQRPATAGPLPGQVIVDPTRPQWLRYQGGGPFFMCGAGDPEGFLYRGTRNPDGTRNGDQMALIQKLAGTGTNGIYLMAVRSHGGDGGPTENPFIDSDPAKGLDPDILDQWETWFTELENAGVTVFFIFYDDSARIWNTGDNVGPEERAFIQGIVNRFEHHKRWIWVIAEEYQEAFSAKRVSNIAAEIRAADDHDHPIAVHKLNGLNFSEFANDPNIDQFAIQYTNGSADGFHAAMVSAWNDAAGRYNLNMAEGHPDVFGSAARLRSWAVAMGGAYIMHLRWDIASTALSDLQDCGRLVSFMESTDFDAMSPRDDLAFAGTQYVLANPGQSYIAYASNLSGQIGLRGMTAGTYTFRWLDIPSGTGVVQTDVAVGDGDQAWTPPPGIGPELAVYITRTGSPPAPPQGDINGDGQVDVADVQACVNQVLGVSPTTPEADLNGDGTVNVLDVQQLVLILLGG